MFGRKDGGRKRKERVKERKIKERERKEYCLFARKKRMESIKEFLFYFIFWFANGGK